MIRTVNKRRFLTIFISAMMVLGSLALTGCAEDSSTGVGQEQNQNQQNPANTSQTVETTLEFEEEGKVLKLEFGLKNISAEPLDLLFSSGHQYDIIVLDSKDKEVYDWAKDKAFTEALINKTLEPGQELSYSEEWDYTDNDGKLLPSGKYTVVVKILAKAENAELNTEELSVSKEFEIK